MRSLSSYVQGQLASTYLRLAVFVSMQFKSSTEYMWSGIGSINWNGQTWKGLGSLGSISTITEDSTLTAQGISVALSSIPSDLLGEALTEVQQGLPIRIYVVFADQNGVPVDSLICYAGRIDQPTIEDGVDSGTISISCENRLTDLQRAQFRRVTDQDQRLRYPTDTGFKYVSSLLDWNGSWGSK